MRIFVTGDSHTAALKRGLLRLEASGWQPAGVEVTIQGLGNGAHLIKRFFRETGRGARIIEPSFCSSVRDLPFPGPEGKATVYCWSGLFHFAKVWRDRTWATHRLATTQGSAIPVSRGMLRSTILLWFRHQLGLIDAVVRGGGVVMAVESPRPFRHHPAFQQSRPETIAAVDRFCQQVMLAELAKRSIPLVRIPRECLDEDGFMDTRWRSEREADPHHGNEEFGALMLRCICRQAQEWFEESNNG